MEHRAKELFDTPTTMPRNSGSRKRGGVLGALLLGGLVLAAALGSAAAVGPLMPKKASARNPPTAEAVLRAEVVRTLPLQGTLQLPDRGFLTAPEAGTVAGVAVRTGEVVARGQELLVLDSRDLREALRAQVQARDGLEAKAASLVRQRELWEQKTLLEDRIRDRELARKEARLAEETDRAARGLASPRALEDLRQDRDQDRDRRDQALAEEALARVRGQADLDQTLRERDAAAEKAAELTARLEGCRIRSPARLLVLDAGEAQVRPGAVVARHQTLISYALLDRAEVRFSVPAYAAGALAPGDRLPVTLGGQVSTARVTLVSQVSADRSTDTAVAALLETLPEPLVSGQSAQTTLVLGREPNKLVLPPGPWTASGRMEWVYRLAPDGRTAVKTRVRLSTDYDQVLVVLEGLKEHDRILTGAYEEFGGAETIAIENDPH